MKTCPRCKKSTLRELIYGIPEKIVDENQEIPLGVLQRKDIENPSHRCISCKWEGVISTSKTIKIGEFTCLNCAERNTLKYIDPKNEEKGRERGGRMKITIKGRKEPNAFCGICLLPYTVQFL